MLKILRKWLKRLNPSYQERMYAYLSQATDRIHLEVLEREWFRNNGRNY
jgi:Ca2+-dependent lipid-binding protein